MKVQKISNIKQQNFGEVIVLVPGGDNSWTDLTNMFSPKSPYGTDWFIDSYKAKLLVSSGYEQKILTNLRDAFYSACQTSDLKQAKQIGDCLSMCIKEFAQRAKTTIIVRTSDNIKNLCGFEKLVKKC